MNGFIATKTGDSRNDFGKLLFRRQFLMGPAETYAIPSANTACVNGKLALTTHPDLEVYQATKKDKSITLIGYLLDPFDPEATNAEIVDGLIGKIERCRDIFEHADGLGGRWVLIVDDGDESILFHDAAGLRQVYFTQPDTAGFLWCASQPGLIADSLGMEPDDEALQFLNYRESSDKYDDVKVLWWPGDTSMYKEIRVLLPNHYIDLRTGSAHRYWPSGNIGRISFKEALNSSLRILQGLMESARNRYELSLSLTAGWDSRVMLALCKDIIAELYCYTLTYPGYTDRTKDVVIPSLLMRKIGGKHDVIDYPVEVNREFKDVCRRNSAAIGKAYCADVQSMYDRFPGGRVCITGDVAEVVKCNYRVRGLKPDEISACDLAKLTNMGTHPFSEEAFGKWLSSAEPRNVDLLDLFCWEQFGGRLQARNQANYDVVHESFSPFNCRNLLVTILSIDEKYRQPPVYRFFRKLISKLWEEALAEPVNPPEHPTIKTLLMDLLIRFHVYQLVPESVKNISKRMLFHGSKT